MATIAMAGCMHLSGFPAVADDMTPKPVAFGLKADALFGIGQAGTWESEFNVYPSLTVTHDDASGWKTELKLAPEIYLSGTSDESYHVDDPYGFVSLTLTTPDGLNFGGEFETTYEIDEHDLTRDGYNVFAESERYGRIVFGDTDSALGDVCVTAPGETSNFAADDLANGGTCQSVGFRNTLRYSTPAFLGGFKVHSSLSLGNDAMVDDGEGTDTLSLAGTYEGTLGGHAVEFSAAVEHVFDYRGAPAFGGESQTVLQFGATYEDGPLKYFASAGAEFFGGTDRTQPAVAIGLDWKATDDLLVAVGGTVANVVDFETAGSPSSVEVTVGAAVEYTLVPDKATIDLGVSHLEASSGSETTAGVGFSWTY